MMKRAFLRTVIVAVALALPVLAFAQFGHPMKGQWSGQWGPANNPNRLLLDLHWDGKDITGTINPGPEAATIKSVTFDYTDPTAWVVKMTAEGKDSTGKAGELGSQSIEYMQAGGGVWHTGKPGDGQRVRGFQLWVALPPELELAPAESHYVEASVIPGDGRLRVLLGSYGDQRSPIPYPSPVTYLHVRLSDGETWTFHPSAGHDLAWLAVSVGAVR